MATLLIETPDGPREYETVESRLSRFRKDSAFHGCRIVTSFQSRAAALGLPDTALAKFDAEYLGKPIFIFRAELLNDSGLVVASRHAMGELQNQKDFETLETIAVGRLLTAVGFGSSCATETDAELTSVRSAFGIEQPQAIPMKAATAAAVSTAQPVTLSASTTAKPTVTSVGATALPLASEDAERSDVLEDPIPARLLPTVKAKHSQMVAEAQRRNVEPPAMPTTMKDAQALLTQFADKHRRVGAAS